MQIEQDNKIYEEYAVLNAQIKTLKAKQDELREAILQSIIAAGVSKVATSVGSFSVTNLKTWTYSLATVQMLEDIKAVKASEESTGEATFEEKPSLRFTMLKL